MLVTCIDRADAVVYCFVLLTVGLLRRGSTCTNRNVLIPDRLFGFLRSISPLRLNRGRSVCDRHG